MKKTLVFLLALVPFIAFSQPVQRTVLTTNLPGAIIRGVTFSNSAWAGSNNFSVKPTVAGNPVLTSGDGVLTNGNYATSTALVMAASNSASGRSVIITPRDITFSVTNSAGKVIIADNSGGGNIDGRIALRSDQGGTVDLHASDGSVSASGQITAGMFVAGHFTIWTNNSGLVISNSFNNKMFRLTEDGSGSFAGNISGSGSLDAAGFNFFVDTDGSVFANGVFTFEGTTNAILDPFGAVFDLSGYEVDADLVMANRFQGSGIGITSLPISGLSTNGGNINQVPTVRADGRVVWTNTVGGVGTSDYNSLSNPPAIYVFSPGTNVSIVSVSTNFFTNAAGFISPIYSNTINSSGGSGSGVISGVVYGTNNPGVNFTSPGPAEPGTDMRFTLPSAGTWYLILSANFQSGIVGTDTFYFQWYNITDATTAGFGGDNYGDTHTGFVSNSSMFTWTGSITVSGPKVCTIRIGNADGARGVFESHLSSIQWHN